MAAKFKIGGLDAHPRKGYRAFARPGKANSRRKLIPQGACLVPLSRAAAKTDLRWSPVRRVRRAMLDAVDAVRRFALAERRREIEEMREKYA